MKLTDRIHAKEALANVQAAIPEEKKAAVEAQFIIDTRHGLKINWRILIESMCDLYLEERAVLTSAKNVSTTWSPKTKKVK